LKIFMELLAAFFGVVVVAYGAMRYATRKEEEKRELVKRTCDLEIQLEQLRRGSALISSDSPHSTAAVYESLKEISTAAQIAVAAGLHSISIPDNEKFPDNLTIILSTDRSADVHGMTIPRGKGLAWTAFSTGQSVFVNRAESDKRHYDTVDKAAGTRTGQSAMMTLPILSGNRTLGVIQFMLPERGEFSEQDLRVAERFIPKIAEHLEHIRRDHAIDIPSIARLSMVPLSILFTDINDFSVIAENVSSEVSISILNEYYRRMVSQIERFEGALEEYLGDGVYASFHEPDPAKSATLATQCGIAIKAEYTALVNSWRAQGFPINESNYITVAIASGMVFEGLMGHPRHRRRKLVGNCVNRGAHILEEYKEHSNVLVVCSRTHELVNREQNAFRFSALRGGEAYLVA
jgi:class 3 adenylate cyclase